MSYQHSATDSMNPKRLVEAKLFLPSIASDYVPTHVRHRNIPCTLLDATMWKSRLGSLGVVGSSRECENWTRYGVNSDES